MQQPQVRVGILSASAISFTLTGIYSTPGAEVVTGHHEVRLSESGMTLEWEGRSYTTLEFTPTSYPGDTFELEGVTIGINFHWERRENQRFRGSLRLMVADGKILAINLVDIEDYLVSVISSEMSSTSSPQLLRAHAVISRSWVLAQMDKDGSRKDVRRPQVTQCSPGTLIRYWDHDDHEHFDVCADDHCQRYQGITRVNTYEAAGAITATRGEVLTFDGQLCDTRFSKCCGGVFEKFENCWEDVEHPYLQPRRDGTDPMDYPDLSDEATAREWILDSPAAFCNTTDRRVLSQVLNSYDCETPDFYRWHVELSCERIRHLITDRTGSDLGDIIDLKAEARGTSGRIFRLRIIGTKGELVIGKELMIRRALSDTHLYSSAFVVEREDIGADGVPGRFILHGAGWGHGVGLCQIGAAIMGERGYAYNEILRHYYPGAKLTKLY